MTALLDRPVPAAPARPVGHWPWSGAAVALALGGLLWSALLWAPASVDLSAGRTSFAGSADVVSLPGYGLRGTHVVDYRHGADVEVVVPLRNDGPLPVTVTGVGAGEGVLPLLAVVDVPGLPLRLGPGEQAEVVLQGALGNCRYYHEREVQLVDGLVLDVEVLGRSTTRQLPLDRPLLVHSPMIVRCPDRQLDRQANDRTSVL